MKIKKILSLLSAGAMALTSLTGAMTFTASAADYDYFTFEYSEENGGYTVKLSSDYVEKNAPSDLVIPEVYNDNSHGEKPVVNADTLGLLSTANDNLIRSITYPTKVSETALRQFRPFKSLNTVTWKNTGAIDLTANTFRDSVVQEVYIYASGVTVADSAFRDINESVKIYVASEDVKNAIVNSTSGGSYPVSADNIEVMESELPTAEVEIACEDIAYGTKGGFNPTVTVKVSGQPVDNPTVTIKMYRNQDCTDEYSEFGGYTSDSIPVGTYYFKATVAGTDTYMGASDVKEVHVTEVVVDKTNLNKAIEEAESFKKSAVEKDYDPAAWKAVYGSGDALPTAKRVAGQEGNQTQDDIEEATKKLTDALETLKKSPADTTAEWAELQELISKVESNRGDYTAESYATVESVLNEAKALSKETATKTAIDSMITKVDQAITRNLVGAVPAGDPFAYVRKKGNLTTILSDKADESLEGTASIKFTFDCASDVSFNGYTSIDLQAEIDGEKSYVRGNGYDGDKDFGFKGRMAVLDLANPIKAGQDINLTVWTYSWDNASDYVYGITKVEFIDAKGHIIKTMNDVSIAKEKLETAIKNAQALSADDYTAESYAALTKAIDAAKALKDDATVADINAAASAITAAIQGLKDKTPAVDNPKPGNNNNNTSATKPSNKTPNVKSQAQKNAEKAMKQAKITKLKVKSKAKKKITVTWKKVSKAKGYQVQVSTNKKFKKSKIILTKTTKKKKLTITKKLKSKKTYFVRVRAYTTYKASNGKTNKVYSDWNKKLRTVKVK